MLATLFRFRRFLGKYRLSLTVGAVLTLASAGFALAQPWPFKVIVDSVLQNKPAKIPGAHFLLGRSRTTLLNLSILAYILILLVGALFDYVSELLMESSGERMVADVRGALFAHLQRLSLRFHSSQRTGDLITRVMNDIDRVQDMLVQLFAVLLPNVVLLVGMMTIMFLIDVPLTLTALAVMPLVFAVAFRYTRRIKWAARRARKREGMLAARTGEVLGAIRVVQAFSREDLEDERFSNDSSQTLDANLEAIRLQAQFSPLVDILAGLGMAVVLYMGTRQVIAGKMSLGLLVVFLSYIGSMFRPMRQLSKLSYVTSRGVAGAERVSEILEAEIDLRDLPGAQPAPRFAGRIAFEDVEFAYEKEPVLRDISLVVEPGEVIALVGPTGAGKSSLVSLLPRFFDPQRGRVLIDGMDVRNLKLRTLRGQIALVLQEPILFGGSIYDNIAYGRPDARPDDVFEAARVALVHEFVSELSGRYETRVGERGATLSGGERQRVSIARALVRNAPILILDEPTSGLDPGSERSVMEALRRLMRGRTTFVIAHRMSTIRDADRVVVLDHGRIIEEGTHEHLMQMDDGMYRSFLEMQLAAVRRIESRTPVRPSSGQLEP